MWRPFGTVGFRKSRGGKLTLLAFGWGMGCGVISQSEYSRGHILVWAGLG